MWMNRVSRTNVHPDLVSVIDLALRSLSKEGTPFKVYSGLRTFKEQDALYAKGRTKPGGIVTKAKGGQSMHNYGLAVDLAPLNLETPEDWDVYWPDPDKSDSIWFRLEEAFSSAALENSNEKIEFEWGGRWKFRDVPHCQVRTTVRELSSGYFPPSSNVEWMVFSHTTFLFNTPWMKKRSQYLLKKLGLYDGKIDGVHGAETRKAFTAYLFEKEVIPVKALSEGVVELLVRDTFELL